MTTIAIGLAAMLRAAATVAAHPNVPTGVWTNPHGSVKVRTGPCGDLLCGWIVWAGPKAVEDAQAGGVNKLVGLELLRSYRPIDAVRWHGQVFVPDWNRTFFSRIEVLGPDRMKISGCILGGLLCKSQLWTRV